MDQPESYSGKIDRDSLHWSAKEDTRPPPEEIIKTAKSQDPLYRQESIETQNQRYLNNMDSRIIDTILRTYNKEEIIEMIQFFVKHPMLNKGGSNTKMRQETLHGYNSINFDILRRVETHSPKFKDIQATISNYKSANVPIPEWMKQRINSSFTEEEKKELNPDLLPNL